MGLFKNLKDAVTGNSVAAPAQPAPTGPARSIKLVKDEAGAPAVDLTKIRAQGHVNLAKSAEAAGVSLQKRGLAGIRAQGIIAVDHSGSMTRDFSSGKVQTLVERGLGTVLQFDEDGSVPVIPWDSVVHRATNVTLANYLGVVDREIWRRNEMGSTGLHELLKLVQKEAMTTDLPLFVCIVTDGEPDNEHKAVDMVCELSRYPVFLKFLAVRPVEFLNYLDNMPSGPGQRRLVDNVNSKPGRDNPRLDLLTCSDAEFQEAMIDEWDSWFKAATDAGILKP